MHRLSIHLCHWVNCIIGRGCIASLLCLLFMSLWRSKGKALPVIVPWNRHYFAAFVLSPHYFLTVSAVCTLPYLALLALEPVCPWTCRNRNRTMNCIELLFHAQLVHTRLQHRNTITHGEMCRCDLLFSNYFHTVRPLFPSCFLLF